jgi:hypothetical protein
VVSHGLGRKAVQELAQQLPTIAHGYYDRHSRRGGGRRPLGHDSPPA